MLIYDIELATPLLEPTAKEQGISAARLHEQWALDGIKYARDWRDFKNMEIACVCVYDTISRRSHVFLEDNRMDFAELLKGRTLGGFNSIKFDNQLLCAAWPDVVLASFDVSEIMSPERLVARCNEGHFDLLREIWLALELDPDNFSAAHKGYGLDAMAKANTGVDFQTTGKSGHGADAPLLWQEGKEGHVINYCLHDVWLTWNLIHTALNAGYLRNPKYDPIRDRNSAVPEFIVFGDRRYDAFRRQCAA